MTPETENPVCRPPSTIRFVSVAKRIYRDASRALSGGIALDSDPRFRTDVIYLIDNEAVRTTGPSVLAGSETDYHSIAMGSNLSADLKRKT